MKVLNEKMYEQAKMGGTVMGDLVEIIGEMTIEYDGEIMEQYLYNIVGYTPENGKPFMARKENIFLV